MISRRTLALGALVALLPSYSSSEGIKPYYGLTDNAASGGNVWSMLDVLPTPPGLEIQGVLYSYIIRKDDGSLVRVYVQNERADGLGYIFRESDTWNPGSQDGTGISRVVPIVPGLPREVWGDGSIEVEGDGAVEDASVRYQYRVDPCFDPQFSPACPGYVLTLPDIYSPELSEFDVLAYARYNQYEEAYEEVEGESDEDREAREEEEERDSRERLEKALAAADTTALFAQALALSNALNATGASINSYYEAKIPGGVYAESVTLQDARLPDSKSGLRNNLAQQQLHARMVAMQYD